MSDEDTIRELEALRAELQQLRAERQETETRSSREAVAPEHQHVPDAPPASDEPGATGLPPDLAEWLVEAGEGDIDPQAVLDTIKSNAGRFLAGFNEDLKDTKPSTLLLVFGLGVMVGRITN